MRTKHTVCLGKGLGYHLDTGATSTLLQFIIKLVPQESICAEPQYACSLSGVICLAACIIVCLCFLSPPDAMCIFSPNSLWTFVPGFSSNSLCKNEEIVWQEEACFRQMAKLDFLTALCNRVL